KSSPTERTTTSTKVRSSPCFRTEKKTARPPSFWSGTLTLGSGHDRRYLASHGRSASIQHMTELPTWTDFAVPTLRLLTDDRVRSSREIRAGVADITQLNHEQRSATLPSGQFVYENRIGWAVSYLKRVDALARPRRGHYQITEIGRELLTR